MLREDFIEQFSNAPSELNIEWADKVMNTAIESDKSGKPYGHHHLIITMEELAELTQEVSKKLRDKGDWYDMLQELADVQICVHYVQKICGFSDEDLLKGMNVKIKQVEDTIKSEGQYK